MTQSSHAWLDRGRVPARLGYVCILLLATLSPFHPDFSSSGIAERIARALSPSLSRSDVIDGARNIVLFAGWGAVWALTAVGSLRSVVSSATITGAAISALVEMAQLFSSDRRTSLLDLVTNTGGALVGAVGLLFLIALSNERRSARSFFGIPTLLFAASYGLAAWLEAAIPLFRQDTLSGASGGPLNRIRVSLTAFDPSSVLDLPLTDLPLFLPAGALAVTALAEHGVPYSGAVLQVAWAGLGLSVIAELIHGALGQPLVAGAVVLHAGTVWLGAWIAASALPSFTRTHHGSARPRALAFAYAMVLAAWAWRPFLPEMDLHTMSLKLAGDWYIPLAALGARYDFFTVVDVCAPFFLYLPLGALLAVWPWRRHGPLSGVWPAVGLALLLESSQVVIQERMLDITDMMVQMSGALIGWAVIRRAGYRPYGEMAGGNRARRERARAESEGGK